MVFKSFQPSRKLFKDSVNKALKSKRDVEIVLHSAQFQKTLLIFYGLPKSDAAGRRLSLSYNIFLRKCKIHFWWYIFIHYQLYDWISPDHCQISNFLAKTLWTQKLCFVLIYRWLQFLHIHQAVVISSKLNVAIIWHILFYPIIILSMINIRNLNF